MHSGGQKTSYLAEDLEVNTQPKSRNKKKQKKKQVLKRSRCFFAPFLVGGGGGGIVQMSRFRRTFLSMISEKKTKK